MVPKTIPYQTMLGKVGKMMTLAGTNTNLHIPDKVFLLASFFPKWSPRQSLPRPCWDKLEKWWPLPGPSQSHIYLIRCFSWLHFFQNVPRDNPLPDHVGKTWKMMTLARTITNPHIHDQVFLLASLFPKWLQRQSLTRPCWEKLKKWWPLPGPSQIYIFLIRLFSWLHFFQNGPQDNPFPNHVGTSWKMKTLARTITNPHIPDKVFLSASLFRKWYPRQSLTRPCWEKFEKWWPLPGPSQTHIFLIRFFSGLRFFQNVPHVNHFPRPCWKNGEPCKDRYKSTYSW